MEKKRLDLQHLLRISAVLDSLLGDCDLPHAIIALEDVIVICHLALATGLSLNQARVQHHQIVTAEESKRLLEIRDVAPKS